MLKKISFFVSALFLLVACSSSNYKTPDSSLAKNDKITEFEKTVGDRVFFKLDSADLDDESKAVLAQQSAWLIANPEFNVIVEGHCDSRGTREYNIALGAKRAKSVENQLVASGVAETRLETVSYGKERPAVIGAENEDTWRQNRRSVTALRY